MIGYHFVHETLRDGSRVPEDGEKLVYAGEIKMCKSGYHFSKTPFDALIYAPGSILCKVECSGELLYADYKGVCRERTILARWNIENLLWESARKFALDVIYLWNASPIIKQFLETGDESARVAAWEIASTLNKQTDKGSLQSALWALNMSAVHASAPPIMADASAQAAKGASRCSVWGAAWSGVKDITQGKHADYFNNCIEEFIQ